ncbi:STAS domain-containing protein [Umezawaea sp.]|uniref:STAS domain-containing protein n=1 Tax=Umezawaea sp. TaxID=1955258 RepID=UPI002ED09EC0
MEESWGEPTSLTVRCGFLAGAVMVTASGELDLDTVPELERRVAAALEAATACTSATVVVVDLTSVSYLDSSGLNMLVRCHELACRHHLALHVVASDRRVLRPIHATELQHVLLLYPTTAEALAPPTT